MKVYFTLMALMLTFQMAFSQTDDKIYQMDEVEVKPSFPDGENAMFQWIQKNLQYPPELAECDVIGRVIVQFVIEKDGSISSIQIAKSLYPSLDKEAARVVGLMPKWNPGKQNGQFVRVSFKLPVKFMF